MESPHDSTIAHWDHEPNRSSSRPRHRRRSQDEESMTRTRRRTKGRFMESGAQKKLYIQAWEDNSWNVSARPVSSGVHWKDGNSFRRKETSKCRCVIGVARGSHSSSTLCGHTFTILCARS